MPFWQMNLSHLSLAYSLSFERFPKKLWNLALCRYVRLNDISHSNLHHRHLLHQTLRSPWPRDSSSPLVLKQTSWLSSSLECWHRPRCAEATPSPNPARKCRRKWRSSFEEGLESLGPVSGRLGCGGGEASRRPESRDGSLGRSRKVWEVRMIDWKNEWIGQLIKTNWIDVRSIR